MRALATCPSPLELIRIIEDWLAAMPRRSRHRRTAPSARPVAPILSIREAMKPAFDRARTCDVNDPISRIQDSRFPLRFSEFPEELEFDAPMLGQHNASVLERYLAYR